MVDISVEIIAANSCTSPGISVAGCSSIFLRMAGQHDALRLGTRKITALNLVAFACKTKRLFPFERLFSGLQ